MHAQPGQVHTEAEVLKLAQQGTTATVEVRGRLTSRRILCDLIAGFAHSSGGIIIFGYHERRDRVVGCNRTRLQRRFEESLQELATKSTASIHFYTAHKHRILGVIYVTPDLIVTRPVVRDGTRIRSMTKDQLIDLFRQYRQDTNPHALLTLLLVANEKIRQLECQLEEANSIWRQVLNGFIGAIATAVVGYMAGLIQVPKWWS